MVGLYPVFPLASIPDPFPQNSATSRALPRPAHSPPRPRINPERPAHARPHLRRAASPGDACDPRRAAVRCDGLQDPRSRARQLERPRVAGFNQVQGREPAPATPPAASNPDARTASRYAKPMTSASAGSGTVYGKPDKLRRFLSVSYALRRFCRSRVLLRDRRCGHRHPSWARCSISP